jgi:hypothetical protein
MCQGPGRSRSCFVLGSSSEAILQGWSFSGLRTAQMCLIRPSATSDAHTVTVTPSCWATRPGWPLTVRPPGWPGWVPGRRYRPGSARPARRPGRADRLLARIGCSWRRLPRSHLSSPIRPNTAPECEVGPPPHIPDSCVVVLLRRAPSGKQEISARQIMRAQMAGPALSVPGAAHR